MYFFQFARYTANMPEIFKKVRAMGSTCEASAFRKVKRAHMKYELTTICKIPYLTNGDMHESGKAHQISPKIEDKKG